MTTTWSWWKIARPNSGGYYGWGKESEAQEFADRLNTEHDLEFNLYTTEAVEEREWRRLDNGGEGFNLDEELAEMSERR